MSRSRVGDDRSGSPALLLVALAVMVLLVGVGGVVVELSGGQSSVRS